MKSPSNKALTKSSAQSTKRDRASQPPMRAMAIELAAGLVPNRSFTLAVCDVAAGHLVVNSAVLGCGNALPYDHAIHQPATGRMKRYPLAPE